MNREQLNQVIQGQSERIILEKSKKTYLSKCKVMTQLLRRIYSLTIVGFRYQRQLPISHWIGSWCYDVKDADGRR